VKRAFPNTQLEAGSTAWSGQSIKEEKSGNTPLPPLTLLTKEGRIIFARDLEPIHTRLEPSPTGPRLHLESETFAAILPASPFILEKLAAKLARTVTA
jgi:hypothetical protein